jgi:hypothetical protein
MTLSEIIREQAEETKEKAAQYGNIGPRGTALREVAEMLEALAAKVEKEE